MRDEAWLLAASDEHVVGLMSYRVDHAEPLLARHSPSLYVTTVAVSRPYRGSGLASALYSALSVEAQRAGVHWLTTRTWSTNVEHMRLLRARGFAEVARGVRGAALDSVYFAQHVTG